MRAWLLMLGGLAIWLAHFTGVYLIASVADVAARADVLPSRLAVGLFTLSCLAADALILLFVLRSRPLADDGLERLLRQVGAVISAVAVFWQGLPAIVGH